MKKLLFVFVLVFMVFGVSRLVPGESQEPAQSVYYEEILIQSGDTLWSLAEKYNAGSMSTKDYVEYIMEFNHMKSDFIKQGSHLVIPVFSSQV